MLNTPFSPWPSYTTEEADIARDVILSNKVNYWTGTEGRAFEKEFADFVGVKHAVAVANGTVALDIALLALGIGEGDEVIVPPRTFLATVSSVVNVGAVPVFADVDPDTQSLCAETIKAAMSEKTKAVIVVHLSGTPADMDPILALTKAHGLKVVEDCAQAHGAYYKGASVGSFGDIAAWSFCQDKIMSTAGEGGMVTTDNPQLWDFMWSYKDHGKSWQAVYETLHPPGFRWLHERFGTNWRLTEVQSAIGRYQLRKLPEWIKTRTRYAEHLREAASEFKALRVPSVHQETTPAWYKLYLFVNEAYLQDGWNRDRIIDEIVRRDVPCFSGSCSEVYLEKAFDDTGWRPLEPLPVARALGEQSLMFLVHPTLTELEISKTASILKAVMQEASV